MTDSSGMVNEKYEHTTVNGILGLISKAVTENELNKVVCTTASARATGLNVTLKELNNIIFAQHYFELDIIIIQ